MRKAKTRKNIFKILSAMLGAVFALITGAVYCVTSLDLRYGINPNSTVAYLGNQQYHIVNDTLENPVPFGEGAHNFEIALQYAFDYNFDVRFTYNVKWSDETTATNVVLHFADRDNIIYDENYIYLADSVSAGNGKVTIITGVDFISTPQDSNYVGKTLKINITAVDIYKESDSYSLDGSVLTKTVQSSVAAQAWIYHKNKGNATAAYAMMYNYRRNYDNGVPYPGLETAYKKPQNVSTTNVTGAVWAGGNRAYAGIGMYVITGSSAVTLDIEVAGIWRQKTTNSNGSTVTDASKSLISENSIRYHYTSDWAHSSWDNASLWETRKFSFSIPAKSSYYIDILDSVEVTSATRITTNLLYDAYRAVTNKITINPDLTTTSGTITSLATEFEYTESSANFVQIQEIHSNSNVSSSISYATKNKDITIVNSSIYSNGLYSAQIGSSASEQTFNTNLSLINNTAETKTVNVTYQLYYHINNTQRDLVGAITQGGTEVRADEYVRLGTWSKEVAFKNLINYTYEVTSTRLTSTTLPAQVTIAPYSSVNLAESYKVGSALQGDIQALFDPIDAETKTQLDGITDYHDAWTYVVVDFAKDANDKDMISTVANPTSSSLAIETTQSGNTVTLSVKNNTTKTITGVNVQNVSVKELVVASDYVELKSQPKDWTASYWKYYSYTDETGYVKLTADPITADNPFEEGSYWELPETYEAITVTKATNITQSGSTFSSTAALQPGESLVFATATTSSTKKIVVSGNATTSSMSNATTLTIVNNGKAGAYLINNTDKTAAPKSYYVKFTGTYIGEDVLNINDAELDIQTSKVNIITDGTNYYYLGIVRPGQIIRLPLSSTATISSIEATGNYDATKLSSWYTDVVALMTNLFNTQK